MKSMTTVELSEEHQHIEEAMDHEIQGVMMRHEVFIPDTEMANFEAEMKRLLAEAASLHTMMMKSKALFIIQWAGDEHDGDICTYDPSVMESHGTMIGPDAPDYTVEFVETPALVKIGTADGEKFECSMVLCKSLVALGEE